MDPVIKAEWVAALRSRRYEQARSILRLPGVGHCCLGVLCDVVDPARWKSDESSQYVWAEGDASASILPDGLIIHIGMPSGVDGVEAGEFALPGGVQGADGEYRYWLSGLNDSGEFTFDQIADLIDYFF